MPPPPGRGSGRGKGQHRSQKPHQHQQHHAKFETVYDWQNGVTVEIKHYYGDCICINPNDMIKLDFSGTTGELARWKVHVHGNGSIIQLESCKTGCFLRMMPNGSGFYVTGIATDPHTYFIVEKQSTPGVVYVKTKEIYRNNEHPYLGVTSGDGIHYALEFFCEDLSNTTDGGNDEVRTARKGHGAQKQQASAPSVADKFFSELGISLVDRKRIVDLARDKDYDKIEDICSSYPALILDGKLRKDQTARVIGLALGLARNNQSDALTQSQTKDFQYLSEMKPFFMTIWQQARTKWTCPSYIGSSILSPESSEITNEAKDEKEREREEKMAKAIKGIDSEKVTSDMKKHQGKNIGTQTLNFGEFKRLLESKGVFWNDKEIKDYLATGEAELKTAGLENRKAAEVSVKTTKPKYELHDQLDGKVFEEGKGIKPNDPNYLTAALIVPELVKDNNVIMRLLNNGFATPFDINCKKNIILTKNCYAEAMRNHEIGLHWTKQDGFIIIVREDAKEKFGHLDGERLKFYYQGVEITGEKDEDKKRISEIAPDRRAIVYSYLSVIQRADLMYQEMGKISSSNDS